MPDIIGISGVPVASIVRRTGRNRADVVSLSKRGNSGVTHSFPSLAGPAWSSTQYHFEDQSTGEAHGTSWSPSGTHSTWSSGTSAVNGTYWGRTSNKNVKGWNIGTDNTPSGNTGPSGGVNTANGNHQTSAANDNYLYSEVSSNKRDYAFVARMPGFNFSTEMGDTSRDLNLIFWLHAYGSQIGDLYVYIDTATTSNHSNATELSALESFTGFTANSSVWQEQTISLNSYRTVNSTHYIYFVTQNATGFRGDLAIDAIQIVESE
jgi:hypothetical protein